MASSIALSVSAFSGGLLLFLAVALLVAFPKLSAVRLWATSWLLAGLACFTPGLEFPLESTFRTVAILASHLFLVLGFLTWYKPSAANRKADLASSLIWGGTVLALVPAALGSTRSDPVAWTLVAVWSVVQVLVAVTVTARRGLRQTGSGRAQAVSLLKALGWGWVPFAVSWMVLTALPTLGWPLGFPPLLVVGAALLLWSLVHFDTRFHHQKTSQFLVERTKDAVLFLAADGRVQAINPAFKSLLDRDEADLVGRPLSSLACDDESRRLLAPLEELTFPDWEGVVSVVHRSGAAVPVRIVCRRIHNPAREAVGAVLLLHDQRAPQRPDDTGREDFLTSLANRRWVLELLEAEFQRVKRYGGPLSALWLEIEHWEDIENRFGREACDDVLRRLAGILKGGLRRTDFCGRVGPRSFLAVLPETTSERAEVVKARLVRMFALAADGETLGAGLSVGVGTLEDEANTDAFLQRVKGS